MRAQAVRIQKANSDPACLQHKGLKELLHTSFSSNGIKASFTHKTSSQLHMSYLHNQQQCCRRVTVVEDLTAPMQSAQPSRCRWIALGKCRDGTRAVACAWPLAPICSQCPPCPCSHRSRCLCRRHNQFPWWSPDDTHAPAQRLSLDSRPIRSAATRVGTRAKFGSGQLRPPAL